MMGHVLLTATAVLGLVLEIKPATAVAIVLVWLLATFAWQAYTKWANWPKPRPMPSGPSSYDHDVLTGLMGSRRRSAFVVRPARDEPPGNALLVWSDGGLLPTLGLTRGAVNDTPLNAYLEADVLAHYRRAFETGLPQSWKEVYQGRHLDIHLEPLPSGVWVGSAHDVTDYVAQRDALRVQLAEANKRADAERDRRTSSEADTATIRDQARADRELAQRQINRLTAALEERGTETPTNP